MNSLAARIALAGALIALIAITLVAAGVLVVGRATFEALMAQHGTAAAVSYEMFDNSVTRVLIGACLLYTSPSPRDLSTSRMPSSA